MKWESAALTDRGRRRPQNEDAFLTRVELGVFAVADGMGGHAAGDVASRLAVQQVADAITDAYSRRFGIRRATETLESAVLRGNREILAVAGREPDKAGMGTTLTTLALVSRDRRAAIAHVGDSRAYLYRDGRLSQLTRDHTWVQEQVGAGLLTQEQARRHPFGNILTQALGTDAEIRVDTHAFEILTGDLLLLCSDGLTAMLDDDGIGAILRESPDLEAVAQRLIDQANERGGHDNITVVLVRITG